MDFELFKFRTTTLANESKQIKRNFDLGLIPGEEALEKLDVIEGKLLVLINDIDNCNGKSKQVFGRTLSFSSN